MHGALIAGIIVIIVLGGIFFFAERNAFPIPEGETRVVEEQGGLAGDGTAGDANATTTEGGSAVEGSGGASTSEVAEEAGQVARTHERTIMETDGTKHSIPLDEILAGGPPKDGIPSIDNPKFTGTDEGDEFLDDDSAGLALTTDGVARFYPYQILVWHEIVNDNTEDTPLLVTYCPLCATGVVFDPRAGGERREFGVSGRLWQSNLLMYDRLSAEVSAQAGTGDPETESLWSQVLGEAVLGPETGAKLPIIRSDIVQYGDWKERHPDTLVLSRDTGANRNYTRDPYGGNTPILGASFTDERLDAKDIVLGVEINGQFNAYHTKALPEGTTTDTFAGETIKIEKSDIGEVDMSVGGQELPYITGFWFSWVAVHPQTALFK